jgi:hypothetical protein
MTKSFAAFALAALAVSADFVFQAIYRRQREWRQR